MLFSETFRYSKSIGENAMSANFWRITALCILTGPVTQSGEYTAPFLMPGVYNVSAQAAGFKQTTEAGIVLRVSDRLVIDIHLEVGAHAEMVTVQATTPLLETANVTLGQVV